MLSDIKKLKQWVCSRIVIRDGKATKPPFQIDGRPASVTDPITWATYDECKNSGAQFVGFVLTKEDPFCIIDLDPPANTEQELRHKAILKKFCCYTETSQSGKGYHLIMRGTVPKGFRRDNVEVYSDSRFMVTTEAAINDCAIENRQDLLNILYSEMSQYGLVKELIDGIEVVSDGEILEIAHRAVNGAKFEKLYNGDQTGYGSQSEADFALLSILCFYSKNTAQVMRIFRTSALGQRDKAQRDNYLLDSMRKIRSNEPPLLDISAFGNMASVSIDDTDEEVVTEPAPGAFTFPPGLVGEMALYIYQSAARPVPEVGLAAALALASGLFGRAYNISNTGLNQYIILLAKTGVGKDGAISGIERLLAALRHKIPAIDSRMGPAGFASGQAILKALEKQTSFLSVIGEVGLILQQMCDKNASAPLLMMRKVLLDLYSRSGQGQYLRTHAYADATKNIAAVESPSVSILGDSTPHAFFAKLGEEHIAEGLVPRFTILEYEGIRKRTNQNKFYSPDEMLVTSLADASMFALESEHNGTVTNVGMTQEARVLLDAFDEKADDIINNANNDVSAQQWNRAHLKALKLSALVAVGVDSRTPEIDDSVARWAIEFTTREISMFLTRFTAEKLDPIDAKQESELLKSFNNYFDMLPADRKSYRIAKKLLFVKEIVPYTYLRRKLARIVCFKEDHRGTDIIIDRILKHLLYDGIIQELPQVQQSQYNTRQRLFICGENWSKLPQSL